MTYFAREKTFPIKNLFENKQAHNFSIREKHQIIMIHQKYLVLIGQRERVCLWIYFGESWRKKMCLFHGLAILITV